MSFQWYGLVRRTVRIRFISGRTEPRFTITVSEGFMTHFCTGYAKKPFATLAQTYPGVEAYPSKDFRVEWGPVFHRGRLDGKARILLIGQDPGPHENVLRRILVGEAGRRVQGFLGKLGITKRYVLINALLYSVYGAAGAKYVKKSAVLEYRNRWIDGILSFGRIEAVITAGGMAKTAWDEYVKTRPDASALPAGNIIHPTFPESAGGTRQEMAANTKKMLAQWNESLLQLFPAVRHRDVAVKAVRLYGDAFVEEDKVDIPAFDLPAGVPGWMYDNDGWASRGFPSKLPSPKTEEDRVLLKRSVLVVKIPKTVIS